MPKTLQTTWRRLYCDHRLHSTETQGHAEYGTYGSNNSVLDKQLNELIDYLSTNGWEIKSVVPLTASRYGTNLVTNQQGMSSTWGAGWGFGATFTEGILVLAQRWDEISQEEADQQQRDRSAREAAKAVANAERQRKAAHDDVLNMPINRRGMFEAKWMFDGKEYSSKKTAENAREALAQSKLKPT